MLDNVEVWPVRTNAGFLFNAVLHPDFGKGEIDTAFIERNLEALVPDPDPDDPVWRGAAAVVLAAAEEDDPLGALAGFRLNASPTASVTLRRDGDIRSISAGDGEIAAVSGFRDDERVVVFSEGQSFEFALSARGTGTTHGLHDGEIEAPMPGKVTAVEVGTGDRVEKGQRLLTLEAMKMEHALIAPFDGTIAELNTKTGSQVTEGQLLVKVEAIEE
jgi:3-methylcrotonyl-CoA carboxylase alpha subunit